jgi:AmpE protein
MTILIVLAGLLISHFATGFRHLRDFRWLMWPVNKGRQQFPEQPWIAFALVVAVSVLVAWLITWLTTVTLGLVGWALLALIVFIYTLGPRDLDQDVHTLLNRSTSTEPATVGKVARTMQLTLDDSASESAAAVLHASLSRWFGILFWFVLLGIPGAILYRLTRISLQEPDLSPSETGWLARLRMVLDWPVLALMVISAGLCGDLDRIHRAWREQANDRPAWLLTPVVLDRIGAAVVSPGSDFDGGLIVGHQMVWRMLVLWLVVLSVMLLAGWLI